LIGYENRDIADKDFRNDAIDAGEVGSGQSATALYELELTDGAGELAADTAVALPMGTVYVRYRNLDTGNVEEISHRLDGGIVSRPTVQAAPRFYLAASAAEFAELLRQSEHAADGSLDALRGVLQQVAVQLPLDNRVLELLDLVTRAKGLPRAE